SSISRLITQGEVTEQVLRELSRPVSDPGGTQLQRLMEVRKKLDHPEHELERLPSDSKSVGGTVFVPDAGSPTGVRELILEGGKLKDSRTKESAGSYDFGTGTVELLTDTGEKVRTGIASDVMCGAVWKLQFSDAAGQKQQVDWITTRPGRIDSVAELRRQADSETSYAKAYHLMNQSDTSKRALDRSEELN